MNSTIIKLAAQALLGRRRFWLLLAFPVLLVALTVTVAALTDAEAAWPLLPGLGYPVVLPLVPTAPITWPRSTCWPGRTDAPDWWAYQVS